MEKCPLLSIIIPVYNLQDFLVGCLDSIYSQNVCEDLFEVVATDDGSTDRSYEILMGYQKDHKNLVVLHQENGGVSMARNYAIAESRGQYVTFVDGDDSLYERSLSQLVLEIQKALNFEIMYCRCYWSMPKGEEKECKAWKSFFNTNETYTGWQLLKKAYAHGGSVWGGYFRESIS